MDEDTISVVKQRCGAKMTYPRLVLGFIGLVLTVHVLGCSTSAPVEVAPTSKIDATEVAAPATDERLGELLEEMFWVLVDAVGESLDMPEINRELGFEDAKRVLGGFLFQQYDEGLKRIESYGIDPFSTWPYCINAISGAMHQEAIELASTPEEAAPHVSSVMDIIDDIETESGPAREGLGQYDEQRCRAFENEKREVMGWSSK